MVETAVEEGQGEVVKRLIVFVLVGLLTASPVFAQAAPDRRAAVAEILSDLPRQAKTPADEGRRANLYAIVRGLTSQGDCCWGVLVKTDQGNKIPGDVIVWRPTMEHFDVITGDGGPFWEAHGAVSNPAWIWQAVPGGEPSTPAPPSQPPVVVVPPPSPAACDVSQLSSRLDACLMKMDALSRDLAKHEEESAKTRSAVAKVLTDAKTWIAGGTAFFTWLLMRLSQDGTKPVPATAQ